MLPALAVGSDRAGADVLRVPEDYPTIQAAVDAAAPADQIRVGPGQWCGATIIGCATSPTIFPGGPRIGFFLPTAAASGTTIRHFVFDGQGVSNTNLGPLGLGIFARDAHNVIVQQNTILGTVQAITATRGSGWTVSHNDILGLTAFTCGSRPPASQAGRRRFDPGRPLQRREGVAA